MSVGCLAMDPAIIPFSRRGAYLAISELAADAAPRPGLWLRSTRLLFTQAPLLRLSLQRDGQELPHTCTMTPSCLHWHSADGSCWAEAVFSAADELLLRVCGGQLVLSTHGGGSGAGADFELNATISQITPSGPGRWRAVCGAVGLLHMQARTGSVQVDAPWNGAGSEHVRVVVDGSDEVAELFLAERDGAEQVTLEQRSFADCEASVREEFAGFRAAQLSHPAAYAELAAQAAYLNWSCLVAPSGRLRSEGMLMSKNWMTSVWSWDHCFNALALQQGDPALAWEQFWLPFAERSAEGCLPDTVQNGLIIRTFTKPPVHGWCFRQLWQAAPEFYDDGRLQQAYAGLRDWTQYWLTHRDPYVTGLPVYYHGNDSGWDNGTNFLAGSPICSPELPALLVVQMRVLAEIATALGQNDEAARWQEQADALLQRSLDPLWTGDGWRVQCPHDESAAPPAQADSLLPYLAVVLGEDLPSAVRDTCVAHLQDRQRFRTDFGLATESQSSPYYSDDGYWRGPIWAPSSMLVIDGLARAGATQLAHELAEDFCRLCARGGFAENFDARRGKGLRDRAYTWTASVFLQCASRISLRP